MFINQYVLLGLMVLFSSHNSFAEFPGFSGRYNIPDDEDVLKHLGHSSIYELDPTSINVLVWNVYKGAMTAFSKDFKLLSEKKDIVLLQEAYLTPGMLESFLESGLDYLFATSFLDKKFGSIPTGVSTGSTALATSTVWQRSKYREPMIKTPKMTLFTTYRIQHSEQELLVGNIHGVNFVRAYKLRHMLDEAAKVLSNHQGPAIFGGDFNTWTKTKLNNLAVVMKNAGFKKVKFKGDPKGFLGKPLDHVFIKNLKVKSAVIPYGVQGSDHKPLLLELSL
jgi:endonuclease/exonuclease/phosphatase (EEP) superfamily protein YafD